MMQTNRIQMLKTSATKAIKSVFTSEKAYAQSLIFILCVGLLLRLSFVSYPSQVVFDEVGFGKLVTAYGWTGERLFDIHPPHGKLLITAGAYIGGYTGTIDFSKIGTPCSESIAPLRFVPALAGTLIPVLVLVVLAQLGGSLAAAFLGAILVAFDNAFVVQSRVIGLDTLLVFFMLSSLIALLAAKSRNGKSKIVFLLLSGMFAALSVGTKFTGLVAPGLAMVILGDDLLREKSARRRWMVLAYAAVFVGAAAAVYLIGWKIHFQMMLFPGEGDAFYVPTGDFISDTIHLHRIMLSANAGITTQHPYSSFWWQWLLMKRPIFYWVKDNAGIYFIGNPLIWWGGGAIYLWLMGYLIFGRARNLTREIATDRRPMLWIPLAGYFISILPLVPIIRPLFMYHYLPALAFALIAGMLWIDVLGFTKSTPLGAQRFSYYVVTGCCMAVFLLLTPITYGFPSLSFYQRILGMTGFGP